MATHSEELKELLLRTDDEFRQLTIQHSELESRLHDLASKHYLSEPEQVEQVTLKKKKLVLKDRMENILRRTRERDSSSLSSPQVPTTH
ncbi:MAG: DUF465 domain-containing protein [Acidobacteria bacterium]|nr:DUF465 domain-containing protein [Acidobacteriota bacterium]